MSIILRAEGLEVGFDETPILKGIDFEVHDGDVLAIIGPNGSGKTTLIRAILGLIPLRAGKVEFFWKKQAVEREAHLAYLPQRMDFDRTFPISLRELLGLGMRDSRFEKYLDVLEIRGLLDKQVGELSGGQMQRALLAYAIGKEPELLIMDEPTSWIDIKGADCVICIMEEFKKRGLSMIVVSHDYSIIRTTATKVLGLSAHGHFFESASSPDITGKINSLFGTLHHEGCLYPHGNS